MSPELQDSWSSGLVMPSFSGESPFQATVFEEEGNVLLCTIKIPCLTIAELQSKYIVKTKNLCQLLHPPRYSSRNCLSKVISCWWPL